MATKVMYRKTPEGYNEVSPPPEDGKRVRFESRPLDAGFVTAAELELKVVSAARDNVEEVDVVVVRCLVGEVLCEVVLAILLPLEETELDITAPETWGASSFDPHISARAVSLTL